MGGKRSGTRQCLYICIACLIAVSFAGCAALRDLKEKKGMHDYISTAERLLAQGDYDGAMKENQKALSVHDNVAPADEALFNIAMIYAHYGYSKRNYEKSQESFKKLVKTFPRSPFAVQAKIWIGLLQDHEKLSRDHEKLSREHEKLSREVEELNKAIRKSKQIDIDIEGKKKEFSK